jgi:DEAD/DEAH box helicase
LAAELHREVDRLGRGTPNHRGNISSILLMKSNVAHVIAGMVGGKNVLDVLATTPLRLIDALDKGLRLDTVRLVVLDEADRLLDAADGRQQRPPRTNQKDHKIKKQKDNNNNNDSSSSTSSCNEETSDDDEEREEEEDDGINDQVQSTSGSY